MAAEVQITGLGDLKQQFAKVKQGMIRKTAFRMVAAAGGVLRKEARSLALSHGLKRSGAMIRNIAIKRERNAPPGTVQYNLGVRHGRNLGRKSVKYLALSKAGNVVNRRENDPYYWRFLNLGTKHIRPYRFIEDSLKNKRTEALAALEDRLKKDLERMGA